MFMKLGVDVMTRRSCVVLCVRERVREIVKWQPEEEEDFLPARDADAAEDEENDDDDGFCGSGSTSSHGFPAEPPPCYKTRFEPGSARSSSAAAAVKWRPTEKFRD